MRMAIILILLAACGGESDDTNEYVCSSCPDQPVSQEACEQLTTDAGCEAVTFALRTDQACLVSGAPAQYSHCVFTNCGAVPACF